MNPATRRRIGLTALAFMLALVVIPAVVYLVDRDGKTQPAPAPGPIVISTAPQPGPTISSATGAAWEPTSPALPEGVTYAYTRIDTTNGSLQLGGDLERYPLGELILPGLAQDYLNVLNQRDDKRTPETETRLRAALAGDPTAIEWLDEQVGGTAKSFTRIVSACQLDDVRTEPLSAPSLDIARYGACLREGTITDADSASWVLEQMRATQTGIGESRGDAALAQQNSVVRDGDQYRAGCLAIGPWWVAAILVDYDQERGEPYGRAACALIADGLFPPDTEKASERKPSPTPSTDAS